MCTAQAEKSRLAMYNIFFSADNPIQSNTSIPQAPYRYWGCIRKKKYCASTKKRLFLLGVPSGHGLFVFLGGYSTPKPQQKKKKNKKFGILPYCLIFV